MFIDLCGILKEVFDPISDVTIFKVSNENIWIVRNNTNMQLSIAIDFDTGILNSYKKEDFLKKNVDIKKKQDFIKVLESKQLSYDNITRIQKKMELKRNDIFKDFGKRFWTR